MKADCSTLLYDETGAFTKLVNDYVADAETIKPFYQHPVSDEGLNAAIIARKSFSTPRIILQEVLAEQYAITGLNALQQKHIDALSNENTFTIVTAHQPNLFTGPLYFLYKILHVIRIADDLNAKWNDKHFVPVFYMGSEDADIDELNHIYTGTDKLTWHTQQAGSVGRMHTDGVAPLIDQLKGQFGFLPHGQEIISMLRKAYEGSTNIAEATFKLVNDLFASFGLLIIIADFPKLKAQFIPIMQRELTEQFSSKLVAETIAKLGDHYKVQAAGRDINLFYLFDDGRRERIEKTGNRYRVLFSELNFSESEMMAELHAHPERFSPNVILRGLYQETILPNIAFVGGGGELAYWLELKAVFEATGVPYPVQILRNSLLLVPPKAAALQKKLGLNNAELFLSLLEQEDLLVARLHGKLPDTETAKDAVSQLYKKLREQAVNIDATLAPHVGALHARVLNGLQGLEKKMQRAERRKLKDESAQLEKLKVMLFPEGKLQERWENMIPYYAQYGADFLRLLYENSLTLKQEFTVLHIK